MRLLLIWLILSTGFYAWANTIGEEPGITGNWKLVKVLGGNSAIDVNDIGKIVMFSKEGKCLSYMDNFPKEADYKISKGYSYATGRKAWLVTFSNTIASDYEVFKSKDTLYLLCSCSEGRHFVFTPTKENLVALKPDTTKSKAIVTKKPLVSNTKPATSKPATPAAPKKKTIPKYVPPQATHAKKVTIKPKPHPIPAKKAKVDTTN